MLRAVTWAASTSKKRKYRTPLLRDMAQSSPISISIASGLPRVTVRSAPAIVFSGPAQRSLTLWPARSRSRLATLYTESSDSFVASAAVSIASGWSEPVPGRELHPLKSSAFHGALFRQRHFEIAPTQWLSLTCPRIPPKIALHDRRNHLALPHCR